MTDYLFGDKTVLRVHKQENEQWAQAVLEETYRNYTGQSPRVTNLDELNRNPDSRGLPKLVEGIADVSGSMSQPINGECKMDVAKLLLLNAINRMIDLPVSARTTFMLRLLGQSSMPVPECQETELVIGPGRLRDIEHYRTVVDKIFSLKPDGRTPLTFTLLQAGNDLYRTYGNYRCTRDIILVSDGAETTCMNNPVPTSEALRRAGTEVHVTAIGLKKDPEGEEQLGAVATPGRFHNTEQMSEATTNAPAPIGNERVKKNGKYKFPSPNENLYGEVQATTSLNGRIILPGEKR